MRQITAHNAYEYLIASGQNNKIQNLSVSQSGVCISIFVWMLPWMCGSNTILNILSLTRSHENSVQQCVRITHPR